jgi:alternate signal-mediated exported protein
MNKMTKGALATGLGVALLVGGGGTLAVWNTAAKVENVGTIQSGDMELKAEGGVWTNAATTKITDITDYQIVPGDKLTFTQPVEITLKGDLMQAELDFTGQLGTAEHLLVSSTVLTNKHGDTINKGVLTPDLSGSYTAKVTVEFKEDITGRAGTNEKAILGALQFNLDQVPVGTPVAASNQ